MVKAEAPLVDTRQSARSTSITREQIDLLPKGRDFTSLVTQAPGANNEAKSNGLMIDGATTAENRYIVDGAETSDLVTGGTGKTVLPDFVEEVQVKSSGLHGRVRRRDGRRHQRRHQERHERAGAATRCSTWEDTRVCGAAPSGYQVGNPTLRLKPNDSNLAEFVTYAKDKYSRLEPGFSFGGPLLSNKAWFYAAYQPTMRTNRADGDLDERQNHEGERNPQAAVRSILSANQTAQIGPKLRTRVAYNNSWSKTDKVGTTRGLPAADGSDVPGLNYDFGNDPYPNYSLSGQADWVVKTEPVPQRPRGILHGRPANLRHP